MYHIFSGPASRADGLAAYLESMQVQCVDVDVVNCRPGASRAPHDLSTDAPWEKLRALMEQGQILGVWLGTPCSTFSRARGHGPGPRPLRSLDHMYGLPRAELTPAEAEQVREGTYFALKSAELATSAVAQGIPFALENPEPWDNSVSLFRIPEIEALASLPGVVHTNFDQCRLGGETAKPTRLLFFKLDLSGWEWRCNHPPRSWRYRDWKGRERRHWGPHPPLVGRRREDGKPATSAASAYPSEMNRLIAGSFAQALERPDVGSQSSTVQ